MNTLLLIPSRGGSKRIPQKNVRFLGGKPLIYYAIKNAKVFKDADVYLSTDDSRVREIGSIFNVSTIDRPARVASDESTVDEVASHALLFLEKELEKKYDIVITLQPTSPLLKEASLKEAFAAFLERKCDTLLSANEIRHLTWHNNSDGFYPTYRERVNSQYLDPYFVENGAFVICKASILRETGSRIGKRIEIFVLPENESVDIDTPNDWIVAEAILRRKRIGLVTNGDHEIGMGHIYRSLTLGDKLIDHDIYYFCNSKLTMGLSKIKSLNHNVIQYDDQENLIEQLDRYGVDIVINDILDTTSGYIIALKEKGFFVVNFEDTGDGSSEADITINALYEWSGNVENIYYGYKYECLREDIYMYPIKTTVKNRVQDIVIIFGGTDVNNSTVKVLRIFNQLNYANIRLTVILGIGYQNEKSLEEFLAACRIRRTIHIVRDVLLMAEYLYKTDIVITGNGRVVFEVVSLGTPLIVLSQNDRENRHMFSNICPGVGYLGGVLKADNKVVENKIRTMIDDYEYRRKMNHFLVPFAKDIRKGMERVVNIIWEKYYEEQNKHDYQII